MRNRPAKNRKRNNENGFTLIEMLVVVAILALLAVIIIPRVSTSLDSSKEATNNANIKLLQSAVERYYFDKGAYPTDDGKDGGTSGAAIRMDLLVNGRYIDKAPENPWKDSRQYQIVNGVVQLK